MDSSILQTIASSATFNLSALLAACIFFAMLAWRELQDERVEGLLFAALAFFFLCGHLFYLWNLPDQNYLASITSDLDVWKWLAFLLAPALIALYLLFGVIDFVRDRLRGGLVKVFFGLTLLCFLHMIGHAWPLDVKGFLTVIWCFIWFSVEFETAR